MKKAYFLFLLLILCDSVSGQFYFSDTLGNNISETVYEIHYPDSDVDNEYMIYVASTSDENYSPGVIQIELEYIEGSSVGLGYCCVLPELYAAGVDSIKDYILPFPIIPNQDDNEFLLYFNPQGNSGTAMYRYIMKDEASGDSTWVDIRYVTGIATDILDHHKSAIQCYPNPASDHINLEGSSEDHTFQIFSSEGKAMPGLYELKSASSLRIDLSAFPNGSYLIKDLESGTVRRFIKKE